MQTWIVLFRGINVGGKTNLPMAKLKALLESLKFKKVRSYIRSGNIILDSTSKKAVNLKMRIGDQVETEFGFRPRLVILSASEFQASIANNPFSDTVDDPKTLHFFFLDAKPKSPDIGGLAKLATATERHEIVGRILYLHTPDGFGRSKLAANAENRLGVPATARNFRTVQKLSSMLGRAN